MLKLMGKKIFTILLSKFLLILTCGIFSTLSVISVGNFFRSPNHEHLVITGHEMMTYTDYHAVEMQTMNFSSLSSYK